MEKKEVMVMNLSQRVEEMEGARRATGISSTAALRGSVVKNVLPNPEVPEKASRRSYTTEYKRLILREAGSKKGDRLLFPIFFPFFSVFPLALVWIPTQVLGLS